jgi:L-ascorbate metabolism protein UlaG (beta-lactamase superfamily)
LKRGEKMEYKGIKIEWLGHSGFRIFNERVVLYIDPFKLAEDEFEMKKADIIFITHSHYDHCSIEDIEKISKDGTVVICPPDCQSKFRHVSSMIKLQMAEIGNKTYFDKFGLTYWGIPAYNINKSFHSKEEDWLGYLIQFEGYSNNVLIYHAGDTDIIPEMKQLSEIDVAFLPIGGNFTMNAGEAAKAAGIIKPKIAIPMHYGTVEGVGTRSDAELFAKNCSLLDVEVKILEKMRL